MQAIRNEKDLDIFINRISIEYLNNFQRKVHDIIYEYINMYYEEYDSVEYNRTFQFLNSIVKSDIAKNGNIFECYVYIDVDNLSYINNTGSEVVDMINRGFHADTSMNTKDGYNTSYDIESEVSKNFWQNSMIKTNEILANTLIQCFKSHGIDVREV